MPVETMVSDVRQNRTDKRKGIFVVHPIAPQKKDLAVEKFAKEKNCS
jgi:hypothetical protein